MAAWIRPDRTRGRTRRRATLVGAAVVTAAVIGSVVAVDMSVINPGPDPIVVEVPAFSQGGATWRAASVTVPASRAVDFVVRGSGVRYDGTQEVPWDDGRLLVDGTSFDLPEQADGWLG